MRVRRCMLGSVFLSSLMVPAGCGPDPDDPEITLVIAGQALIKKDPEAPVGGSVRLIAARCSRG